MVAIPMSAPVRIIFIIAGIICSVSARRLRTKASTRGSESPANRILTSHASAHLGFPQFEFVGHDNKLCGMSRARECELPVRGRIVLHKSGTISNDLGGEFSKSNDKIWHYKQANSYKEIYEVDFYTYDPQLWPEDGSDVFYTFSDVGKPPHPDISFTDTNNTMYAMNGEWYDVPFPADTFFAARAVIYNSNNKYQC